MICRNNTVYDHSEIRRIHAQAAGYLRRQGISLEDSTVIVRADTEAWIDGFTSKREPDVLGTTRWEGQPRRARGSVYVEIAAGIPRPQMHATISHELGHVVFARTNALSELPHMISEGIAEAIAAQYLEATLAYRDARSAIDEMAARTDPIYGVGFRLARRAIAQHGLMSIINACATGDPGAIGLGVR